MTHQATAKKVVIIFTYGVRQSVTKIKSRYNAMSSPGKQNERYMRENNDHLLTWAWWVTLKSTDFIFFFIHRLFFPWKKGLMDFLRSNQSSLVEIVNE